MSVVYTILGWAEWIALVAIGIEIIIAAWKISAEHNLDEGFRKLILATAGGVLILSLVNYFVPQVNNIIPSSVLSLPGAVYIEDLAIAAFAVGAIYGGYLVAKGDLESGFEMIALVATMFILMASASSLFSSSSTLPTNVQLQQLTANAQANGISLNFIADIINFATTLPSGGAMNTLASLTDQYATAIAVIGLIILTVWRFLFDMETELMRYLVTIVKDIVVVAILIAGALSIWSGFAEIINGIIATMLNNSNVQTFLNEIILSLAGWIIGGLTSGYFVPLIAYFTATLLEMSIIAFDLALARYLIISAAIGLAPILAALWLWPPLRRVVEFIAYFVLGMAIGGIIAAGAIYILASSGLVSKLAVAFSPFVLGILPWAGGVAFGGVGASSGGGLITKGFTKGSYMGSSASSGGSAATALQNTKQQQIPQTTTLNRPTTVQVPQQQQPQQQSPLLQSIKNNIIPPTAQRVMNRPSIQTQAPVGAVSSSLPSGFAVKKVNDPNPVIKPQPGHSNVTIGDTTYGIGMRLTPKNAKLDTVIRQGRVSGNQISDGKKFSSISSNAPANVMAQETKFHAFVDALKQNTLLFVRHFDMSLQRRLGISPSMLRPTYGQDVGLNRPTNSPTPLQK